MRPKVSYAGIEFANYCNVMSRISRGEGSYLWHQASCSDSGCSCCCCDEELDCGKPWQDESIECSCDFVGFLVDEVEYGTGFTRSVNQGLGGGWVSPRSIGPREITITGYIVSQSEGGTDFALEWLNSLGTQKCGDCSSPSLEIHPACGGSQCCLDTKLQQVKQQMETCGIPFEETTFYCPPPDGTEYVTDLANVVNTNEYQIIDEGAYLGLLNKGIVESDDIIAVNTCYEEEASGLGLQELVRSCAIQPGSDEWMKEILAQCNCIECDSVRVLKDVYLLEAVEVVDSPLNKCDGARVEMRFAAGVPHIFRKSCPVVENMAVDTTAVYANFRNGCCDEGDQACIDENYLGESVAFSVGAPNSCYCEPLFVHASAVKLEFSSDFDTFVGTEIQVSSPLNNASIEFYYPEDKDQFDLGPIERPDLYCAPVHRNTVSQLQSGDVLTIDSMCGTVTVTNTRRENVTASRFVTGGRFAATCDAVWVVFKHDACEADNPSTLTVSTVVGAV